MAADSFSSIRACVLLYTENAISRLTNGKINQYLSQIYHIRLVKDFACYVSPTAQIDLGLHLPHPTGIVIGAAVIIGKNCSIYQNVTIGGANIGDAAKKQQPHIGDECTFFAGSMVLGNIFVSSNCVVGANSVLLEDASSGVYVGSPARLVHALNSK